MARINIVHTTEYTYRNPVGLLRHKLMIRPDKVTICACIAQHCKVEPEPTGIWKHDVFNNSICFLEWPEALRTKRLSILSTLDITHHPDGQPLPSYSLDAAAETFPFSYTAQENPRSRAPCRTPDADPDRRVKRLGPPCGVCRRQQKETLKVLEVMTDAIKEQFRYGARHEEGTHTAAQTLELGSGTCRDFAVLMMEALRSFGFATRFVTGYLYDDTSGTTRGGGSTHAWCSVYLPGAGWVEYDPTNGLVAGANLIRVGVTREAEQALPISGGFVGDANDPTGLHVDVSVSAVPTP